MVYAVLCYSYIDNSMLLTDRKYFNKYNQALKFKKSILNEYEVVSIKINAKSRALKEKDK